MPYPADRVNANRLVTTDLERAAAAIRGGGLVAIPTETVYGLAADARQPAAVARVFAIKGRPSDHPLIVHLADTEQLDGWVGPIDDATRIQFDLLAEACWPGPLTMLVQRGRRVIDAVTGGRSTVGLRVPAHPMAHALLRMVDTGLAAPSANRFGKVSPTSAAHVLDDLADLLDPRIDVVLDGGECPVGVESTIVDLTSQPPQVLRAGAITADQVAGLLRTNVVGGSGPSRASGMLDAHYAPDCEVVLVDDSGQASIKLAELTAAGRLAAVLDRTDDLVVAAQRLYADLRAADQQGLDTLVVVLPAPNGLGHALRDRLLKAAAGSRRVNPSRGC